MGVFAIQMSADLNSQHATMEAIAELVQEYFLLRFFWSSGERCIDWAVTRLGNDEEGDDLEIVLLAGARGCEEILPLVQVIVERYCDAEYLNDEFLAGKYVAALRAKYLNGNETLESLDGKFSSLYSRLGYTDWLTMLSRNCEYATDMPEFLQPFEQEFEYIASLWAHAKTLSEFKAGYSREKSAQHDPVLR